MPIVASVEPGETFEVECAINVNDGTIRHRRPAADRGRCHLALSSTAPPGRSRSQGAKAGDMLSVEILDMELDTLGFTSLWPGIGMFPDWVRRKEFGIQTRVVEVKDGFVHWNDKLKLPVKPMIGVHRRRARAWRGADRRQRPAWRQSRRPGDHHRQHRDVPRQQGRRAPLHRRLPCHPGRRRGERHGRHRDRRRR